MLCFGALLSFVSSFQLFLVAAKLKHSNISIWHETSLLEAASADRVRDFKVMQRGVMEEPHAGLVVDININVHVGGAGAASSLQAGPSILVGASGSSRLASGLGKCALVGSGSSLQGKKLGDTIDSYDTVVRVNRLPTPELIEDVGEKSTVLFAKQDAVQVSSTQILYMKLEGKDAKPDHVCQRGSKGDSSCPFEFLVVRDDVDAKGHGYVEPQERWSVGDVSSGPANLPPEIVIQQVLPEVDKAIHSLINSVSPTTGFRAFLTMAHVCDLLQLWGFSHTGETIDSHDTLRSLDTEHNFFRMMSQGDAESLKQAGWPESVVELAARKRGKIMYNPEY